MLAGLQRVLSESTIAAADVRRVTCFYEDPKLLEASRQSIAATFPKARSLFVYSYAPRDSTPPAVECEAIAGLAAAPDSLVRIVRGFSGRAASPFYSLVAIVKDV